MAIVIYEVDRPVDRALGDAQVQQVGRLLAGRADISRVWVSAIDEETARAHASVLFAVDAIDLVDAARIAQAAAQQIETDLQIPCVAHPASRTGHDAMPNDLADMLGLQLLPNTAVLITLIK